LRKEGYVFLIAMLAVFGLLVALLPSQSMAAAAEDRYVVGGEIIAEAPASGSLLTNQTTLAAIAVATAAAAAGILVSNKRKI